MIILTFIFRKVDFRKEQKICISANFANIDGTRNETSKLCNTTREKNYQKKNILLEKHRIQIY